MEVDLESFRRPLGGRFGGLLEVDLRSIWGRFGGLLEVSWRSLGGLSAVSWRSLGTHLEVDWKSAWQCILRSSVDDVGAFRSVVESLWLAMDLNWS